MKIFFLDLWQDLQAKRLAPVAVVLVLALIAVPVVLSKPAKTTAPPPTNAVRSAPDPKDLKALASVKLANADDERGSSLDTFDPSDPFRPPKSVTKKKEAADTNAPSSVAGNTSGGSTSGDTSGGGDTGSTGGGITGDTGGGTTGDTGGGDQTQTVQYRYVVDVTFITNGHTRHIKGLERLQMLPSEDSPLLLFLGVTPNAGNAVFLVDSTLDAAGEGSCKPRASECAFLYIGAGSEHAFTNDDGDSYRLRIDEIRKVRVGASASASRAKRAHAAVGSARESQRFSSPLIADEESVSSGGNSDSTDNPDRR
jgi:hypothetical protein